MNHSLADAAASIGRRIHVASNSAAGKSTLAEQLAQMIGAAFVELDALTKAGFEHYQANDYIQ